MVNVEVPITLFSMWAVYHMACEVEWYSRCVSSEHAIGCLILATLWHLNVLSQNVVLTHTAGYFVFDSFVVITHLQDFRSETGTFVHHGVGLLGSWLAILFRVPIWLCKYYLLTEASTVFVNLRWNFYVLKLQRHQLYLVVGLLMSISFFIFRTLPLPYVWFRGALWVWWGGEPEVPNMAVYLKLIQTLSVSALCCLNAYWSYKIFQGLRKAFSGKVATTLPMVPPSPSKGKEGDAASLASLGWAAVKNTELNP
ncbi:TLC domain [Balamuthia mandrillaris]